MAKLFTSKEARSFLKDMLDEDTRYSRVVKNYVEKYVSQTDRSELEALMRLAEMMIRMGYQQGRRDLGAEVYASRHKLDGQEEPQL